MTDVTPVLAEPAEGAEQVTQLLPGEPYTVLEPGEYWSRIVAPWQPSRKDPRGYPGWARTATLAEPGATSAEPGEALTIDAETLLAEARRHLGTPYVWGGMTTAGIDCSGLTHMGARAQGLTIPRDASDQQPALPAISLADVRPGDLYFFAHPGKRIHHVGIATAPAGADGSRPMVHASYVAGRVVEEPMDAERLETLVAAVRITG